MDRPGNSADRDHARDGAGMRLIARTALWSLWLPFSIAVVFAVGSFSYGIYDDRPLVLFLTTIVYWLPLPSFLNTLFGAALAWLALALLCVGRMIRRVLGAT